MDLLVSHSLLSIDSVNHAYFIKQVLVVKVYQSKLDEWHLKELKVISEMNVGSDNVTSCEGYSL